MIDVIVGMSFSFLEMESPQALELFKTILKYVKAGDWIAITLYVLVFYSPAIFAWFTTLLSNRKIEILYKERLRDKDNEIQRQADRIKELENATLARKRK
jgi:hypothetical protein